MTIDEAIKGNMDIQTEFLPLPRHRDWEAIQLGIEALKQISNNRTGTWVPPELLLPGGTKD